VLCILLTPDQGAFVGRNEPGKLQKKKGRKNPCGAKSPGAKRRKNKKRQVKRGCVVSTTVDGKGQGNGGGWFTVCKTHDGIGNVPGGKKKKERNRGGRRKKSPK